MIYLNVFKERNICDILSSYISQKQFNSNTFKNIEFPIIFCIWARAFKDNRKNNKNRENIWNRGTHQIEDIHARFHLIFDQVVKMVVYMFIYIVNIYHFVRKELPGLFPNVVFPFHFIAHMRKSTKHELNIRSIHLFLHAMTLKINKYQ